MRYLVFYNGKERLLGSASYIPVDGRLSFASLHQLATTVKHNKRFVATMTGYRVFIGETLGRACPMTSLRYFKPLEETNA